MPPQNNEILEALSCLLRAADDDAELRDTLLVLLRLPSAQRSSLVHTSVEQMTLRGEPAAIRTAFLLLATDEATAVALRYLSRSA